MRGDDGAEGVLDDVWSESNARVDTLKVLSGRTKRAFGRCLRSNSENAGSVVPGTAVVHDPLESS